MNPDQVFLEMVVKGIVDYPDDVEIKRTVDEMGVLLDLKVNPLDMGKVIGRSGVTAKAIRTLVQIIGTKNSARVSIKIFDPRPREVGVTRPV